MNCKMQKAKLERSFIRAYREDARVQQNSECAYCFERLTYKTNTADHKVAKANGGSNGKSNIEACCRDCNGLKGKMSPAQFKKLIKSFPHGHSVRMMLAWSRRRINLATNRSCERIKKTFGLE